MPREIEITVMEDRRNVSMNRFNTGEVYRYEIWGAFHVDIENYPDRVFYLTNNIEAAICFLVPKNYEKVIIEETIKRNIIAEAL